MITSGAREFLWTTGEWHEVVGTHFYKYVLKCGQEEAYGFRTVLIGPYPSESILEALRTTGAFRAPGLGTERGHLCAACFPRQPETQKSSPSPST